MVRKAGFDERSAPEHGKDVRGKEDGEINVRDVGRWRVYEKETQQKLPSVLV
jgi:hypothetical protein